jgi:chromosome segregation ATPase
MADVGPAAREQLSPEATVRVLKWLEDQRLVDRDRLGQVVRALDELRAAAQEQAARLARLEAEPPRRPSAEVRPGSDALNQLYEQVSLLARRFDEHEGEQQRTAQAEVVLHDRERRQVGELAQGLEGLGRVVDSLNGRILALVEEVRRERDSRAPIDQSLEDLQRRLTALQGRLSVVEELSRRYGAVQSLTEQRSDKQQGDLTRLDNQVKLIEVRVNRDLGELRRGMETWYEQATEQLKPLASLVRNVAALAEERDSIYGRIGAAAQSVEQLSAEIGRLEATMQGDRAAAARVADAAEGQVRRIDEVRSGLWQVREQVSGTEQAIERVRAELRGLTQRLDESVHHVSFGDEQRRQIETALTTLTLDLHQAQQEARDRIAELTARLDAEVASLSDRLAGRQTVAIEHLRRTVGELQGQLQELEAGAPSD